MDSGARLPRFESQPCFVLTSYMTMDKLLHLSILRFPICHIGLIVPSSQAGVRIK